MTREGKVIAIAQKYERIDCQISKAIELESTISNFTLKKKFRLFNGNVASKK